MRYFRLLDEVTYARWHLGPVTDLGGTEFSINGAPCKAGPLSVKVSQSGIALDFSFTSFGVPVVKPTLGAAMASVAAGDLQRLPIYIHGYGDFEVLNPCRVIDCLDETRSEFVKWQIHDHRSDPAGQYRSVPILRIRPLEIPPDADFFLIKNWEVALVVSARLKFTMNEVGCVGAKFIDVT